jgi:hypothetical protein
MDEDYKLAAGPSAPTCALVGAAVTMSCTVMAQAKLTLMLGMYGYTVLHNVTMQRYVCCVNPPLGERRHDLRVVADEGRVDALVLQELANQLVQQACWRLGRWAVDIVLDTQVHLKHAPRTRGEE